MISKSELKKEFYKSGETAKIINMSVRTVQEKCKTGELYATYSETNRLQISRDSIIKYLEKNNLLCDDPNKQDVIYARVSTNKQKKSGDLNRQVQTIINYAINQNPRNIITITDVGSGLNDNRKGLNKLLKKVMNDEVDRIFINYKDRLTRFGFNYLKTICDHHEVDIIIVSDEELNKSQEEELAEDIISVIHSFSGKLYGSRSKIKKEIEVKLKDG